MTYLFAEMVCLKTIERCFMMMVIPAWLSPYLLFESCFNGGVGCGITDD